MSDLVLGENLSRGGKTFDKLLELRDVADGAETATAAETGIAFAVKKFLGLLCVVYVTAIDATTGDESYVLSVEVAATVGGSYTVVSQLPNIRAAGTGIYKIALDGALAAKLLSTAAFVRINATLAGTTPSITYGAYLAYES